MFILIQILVALAAWWLGRHDAPACDNFAQHGSTPDEQSRFHGSNWKIKAVIAVMASLAVLPLSNLVVALLLAISNTFILWTLFNISLNLARFVPERSWDYVSESSNKTDVWLTKKFGNDAGFVLAAFSFVMVLTVNLLTPIFYGKTFPDCFRLVQLFSGY